MKRKAFAFHAVAGTLSVLWLLPIALVLLTAIRTFDDIAGNGLGAMPSSFSLDSFGAAWNAAASRAPCSTACSSRCRPCCSRWHCRR